MTTTVAVEPVSDSERGDRRAKFEARRANAKRARAALKGAEAALRVCDEHIKMRRAAILSNQQELQARKAERAGLVEDRKRWRKEAARTAKKAEKAEARYDRAVLAHVVDEAKDAEHSAAGPARATQAASATGVKSTSTRRRSATTKRTPRRTAVKSTPASAKKASPAKDAARKTSPAKRTAKRTGGTVGASASGRPRATPAKASSRRAS